MPYLKGEPDFSSPKAVVAGLKKGGARIGAGRKRKNVSIDEKDEALQSMEHVPEWAKMDTAQSRALKEVSSAYKEYNLARAHELEYLVKSGQYLPRAAYREATATLLATLAQRLRSLPDELERRCSLPPDVLVRVEQAIDESLAAIAHELAPFSNEGT